MANTGFTAAGAGSNNADAGGTAFTNPGNIVSDDGAIAEVKFSGGSTQYLYATSFGFAIPAGSTINGVIARVQRATLTSFTTDAGVYLLVGGSRTGSDKSIGGNWPADNVYRNIDYGGAADLWGTSLTVSDVNASNFGLAFRANRGSSIYVGVDVIWMDIYYTAPATGQPAIKRTGGVAFMAGSTGNFGRGRGSW